MRNHTGFTLIELMIVIAIVAILAAMAVPAFQAPIARAKLVEAVGQLDQAKTAISEYVATQGNLPLTAADAGISGVPGNAQYIDSLSWDSEQKLIAVKIKNVSGKLDGKSLYFAADKNDSNEVFYVCGSDTDSQIYSYIPAECRRTLSAALSEVKAKAKPAATPTS